MASQQTYTFKIRTSSNGIVGNVKHNGTSQPDAEIKLRKQYPGCTVLDVQVK